MQFRYLKSTLILAATIVLMSSSIGYSQSISGPSPVTLNQVATYSFDNGMLVKFPSWQVTKGTIQSSTSIGTKQLVTVKWTSTGTGTIKLYSFSKLKASKNVTISPPINAGSVAPSSISICYGSSASLTLQNNDYPVKNWQYATGPDYINWTAISTTSTTYTTPALAQTRRYRAVTQGALGTYYSSAATITVNSKPATPPTPSVTQYCGSSRLTRTNPPSGYTYYWQTSYSGTSTGNSSSTYTVTSSKTIYLRSRSNSSGCWSGTQSKSVTVATNPATPATPTTTYECSRTKLTRGTPPSGVTWYWQGTSSTGKSTSNTNATYYATSAGTYYIRARLNSSPYCWSASRAVSVSITQTPATPGAPTIAGNCGSTTLTRGTPPSGVTWYWQGTNSSGTSTSNSSATYSTSTAGTYYLRARLNASPYCWSSSSRATTVSVATKPATPDVPTLGAQDCESTSISYELFSTDVTWYWQGTNANGTSTTNSNFTYTVTTSGTYYLRSRNNTSGCWGNSSSIYVTVHQKPADLTNPTNGNERIGTGSLTLDAGTSPAAGNSFAWYTSATGGTPIAGVTGQTYTPKLSTTTTYYIAEVDGMGCESANRAAVTGTIYDLPLITVNGAPAQQTTNNAIVVGQGATLAASAGFDTYLWQVYANDLSGTPIQTSTQATIVLNTPGACILTVTKGSATYTSGQYMLDYEESTTKVNYVQSKYMLLPGVANEDDLSNLPVTDMQQSITYSDGLSRVIQTRVMDGAGANQDIVQNYTYDEYGRASTQYLPFTATANQLPKDYYNLAYATSDFDTYYTNQNYGNDNNYPFAITLYDNTPLHRVVEQGAPGADWQPGNGHTVLHENRLNTATENVRKWDASGQSNTTYTANQLAVTTITDENGHLVRSYTDSRGLRVLKQVEAATNSYLNTYYVYDNFGRPIYTIPPKAVEAMPSAGYDVTAATVTDLIYSYTYDTKGRLVEKKVPGAQPVYLVYDKFDRLVLQQDGNLRVNNQWSFIKYDTKGRAAYTGVYTNTVATIRQDVQALVDGFDYENTWFEVHETNATYKGYSNQVFPTTNLEVLAVNYYDDYDFDRNGTADYTYNNALLGSQEPTANSRTRGMSTGQTTKILGSTNWLTKVVFYDDKGRLIEWQSNNHLDAAMNDAGVCV